ncbi:MAG TPA: hypothetical protein VHL85_00880 [Burkholderiales bacterium]|nr:hypothetical protein [Burkholderiales bacterium]
MNRIAWCVLALGIAALPARAQDSEVAKLREELKALQQRMLTLEKKLQEAETKPAAAQPSAQAGAEAGESAFNPGISAILNGVYANLQRDPGTYRINGFVPTMGDVGPGRRGASLGESELGLSANVDPMFRGTLIAAIAPDNNRIEVEEGYVQTLGLSNGVSLKAGRFFSELGYQNRIHAHAWDFTDAPLAMKAFLGGQLAEDGVQLKWIAPTELYIDAGLELGRGRAFPASDPGKNGFGSTNLFTHAGGDIGESLAWQAGLSLYATSPRSRTYGDTDSLGTAVTNSFTGSSRTWTLSGVLKWAPEGNSTNNNLKLQGEYFRRRESGSLTYDTTAASLGTMTGSYGSRQSGWYAQAVYQFMPMWRAGYRYDTLSSGTTTLGLVDSGALPAANFPILGAYNPKRQTFMVDWSPSEFSRVRLQLARDYSRMGLPDNQVFLQYIMSLGAHGAHTF